MAKKNDTDWGLSRREESPAVPPQGRNGDTKGQPQRKSKGPTSGPRGVSPEGIPESILAATSTLSPQHPAYPVVTPFKPVSRPGFSASIQWSGDPGVPPVVRLSGNVPTLEIPDNDNGTTGYTWHRGRGR